MATIPVVDFGCLCDPHPDPGVRARLVDEVYTALSTVGFMYITNHGINKQQISDLETVASEFFELPREVKEKYARIDGTEAYGWVDIGREQLDPEKPYDIKEAYNYARDWVKSWPDDDVPQFRSSMLAFYDVCCQLSHRVMHVMAEGLQLEDKDFFTKCHNFHTETNQTTLRLLHYPEIPADTDVRAGQLRCGEHSDYGSITLLFQDAVGGLQVMSRSGSWVDATPIPDTILVNIGDFMQRWTSDTLISTKHRVIIPDDKERRRKSRRSYAFFVHPDADYVIECVGGSNKYPPITSRRYLEELDKLKYT